MYKQKYHKYLTGGTYNENDPDVVDYLDADDLIVEYPESDFPERDLFDEALDEDMEQMFEVAKGRFLGFDKDPDFDDPISEDLSQNIVDIGIYGKARGKLYDFYDFDKKDFITIKKGKNQKKILIIADKDSFDNFTNKYGFIGKDDNLYINWNNVRRDYKGFYLASSALQDRETDIPYQQRTEPNWVFYDFNYIDNVIIFNRFRNLINSRNISQPFKGKVVDEYAIEDNDFARITDPITNDKILLIDDVQSFDKFTSKYGKISTKKKIKFIDIKWNEVNKDYDGFYIDKDNDFYQFRYQNAFYKGKLYTSWWIMNNIEQGVVYLFE